MKTLTIILCAMIVSYATGSQNKNKPKFTLLSSAKSTTTNIDTVRATVYYPDKRQCDADYWTTADMSKIDTLNPIKHRWIAISQDQLKINGGKYRYGDAVTVIGIGKLSGTFYIHDCMNKRFKSRIDILVGKQNTRLHYKSWSKVTMEQHS